MTKILVYCDDPSHTAVPVGPIITDPDPVLPDDVYIVDMLHDGVWSWEKGCPWCGQRSGRWKGADLAAALERLAEQGVTGISLRELDLRKHSH